MGVKRFAMLVMVLASITLTGASAKCDVVAGINPEMATKVLHNMERAEKKEAKKKQEARRKEDIEMLAHLINCENATYESRLYTGSVVLNRVKSSKYPDTIEEVIWQRGQYACIIDGHYWWTPDKQSYDIAERLIDDGSAIPDKVLYAAEFKQGKGVWAISDGTYYCY